MPDITSFGELLVDIIGQERSGLKRVENFQRRAGGAPANFAVACSQLGMGVDLIAKVGEDSFGDFLYDYVKNKGVNTDQIRRSSRKTTLAFVSLDQNSVPDYIFYRKNCADTAIRQKELDLERVKDSQLFHFGSLSLTTEPIRSTLFHVLSNLPTTKVSCDPNLRQDLLSDDLLRDLKRALNYVDYLLLSEDELEQLSETETVEKSEQAEELLRDYNLKEVVITCGRRGSEVYSKKGYERVGAIEAKAEDTTGAGDAFAAGYLSSVLKGKKRVKSLRWGNAVGACCVQRKGGMSSLPRRKEVKKMLKNCYQSQGQNYERKNDN